MAVQGSWYPYPRSWTKVPLVLLIQVMLCQSDFIYTGLIAYVIRRCIFFWLAVSLIIDFNQFHLWCWLILWFWHLGRFLGIHTKANRKMRLHEPRAILIGWVKVFKKFWWIRRSGVYFFSFYGEKESRNTSRMFSTGASLGSTQDGCGMRDEGNRHPKRVFIQFLRSNDAVLGA